MEIIDIGSNSDRPQQFGLKEYADWGGHVSVILRMSEPRFGTCEALFMCIDLCVSKCTTNLYTKGVYAGYIINKRCCFLKEVPWDLIDTRF